MDIRARHDLIKSFVGTGELTLFGLTHGCFFNLNELLDHSAQASGTSS
jgi:hypothetical protein